MNNKQSEIQFQVGCRVVVKPGYTDKKNHRYETAVVVSHEWNPSFDKSDPFIDNVLRFESGVVEPFANWEIENETENKNGDVK